MNPSSVALKVFSQPQTITNMKKFFKQLFCTHKNLNRIEGNLIPEHIFCKDCEKCLTDKKAIKEARTKAVPFYAQLGINLKQ